MTAPAPHSQPGNEDAVWLIVKRSLYFMPNCQGYTGIRDHAGRYTEEVARGYADHGCTLIHEAEAPEFTSAAFPDLVLKHVTGQRDALRSRVEELTKAPEKAEELYLVGLLNAPDGLANEVVSLRRAALASPMSLEGRGGAT